MMKESKRPEEELKCIAMLVSISQSLGDLASARDLIQAARGLAKQLKTKSSTPEIALLRAGIHLESEQFPEARHCLKRVLKLVPASDDEFRPRAKKMLAVLPKLESLSRQVKGTAEDNVTEEERIKKLDALADGFCSVECYHTASRFYKQLLQEAKQAGKSRTELAAIYVSLAQTGADLKNYGDAIRYARAEIKLRDDPMQRCRTWLNIADYTERRDVESSGDCGAGIFIAIPQNDVDCNG